ncbi:MAG TPA: helicase-related protein [Vicinamibacterales bacterium]
MVPKVMEILQLVMARGRRWRVADVRAYESCQLVTLISATSAPEAATCRLLTPFDELVPIGRIQRPRRVSRQRWRRACRALVAADVPPGSLQAAAGARFDLLAYQLQPAMAVIRGLGTRVLLADEVGLGKTVQASLVFAELLARGRADRVLVAAPAGLRDQWAAELAERFGIASTVASAASLRQLARALPLDVNPWETTPVAIASIDYIKRPEVLPAVAACRWDVLVIDEAHAAVGDSERYQAARLLAGRSSYVLLLTATPHSGDPRAFDALRDLGAERADDRLLVFRRLRQEVQSGPGRRTHLLRVRACAAERRMFEALARYHDAVRLEQPGQMLTLSVLHKRAFSSAWSLAASVDRRLRHLERPGAWTEDGRQIRLPFEADGETCAEDEPPEWPANLALSDAAAEKRLLVELDQAARNAFEHESKIHALVRLLRRAREPALVFTEYRDTATHLSTCLDGVPVLHGGLDSSARRAVVDGFTKGNEPVLVATDAGGQGLNLHRRCRLVINLELPWNPVRLEQRTGRVDRIGQTRRVHAVHLVGRDTGESDILSRLERRMATASASLAGSDAIGDQAPNPDPSQISSTRDPGPGLVNDAQSEASRLAAARRLRIPGDEAALMRLESGRWWTVRARPKMRRRLGRHGILIYRVTLVDGAGGIAGSHLVGLAHTLPLVGSAADSPALINAIAEWSAAFAAADQTFWRRRIRREEWIVASVEVQDPGGFQPGLFDRRTERRRAAEHASREAFCDLVRARLTEARRRAGATICDVDLMLALHP